MTQMTQKTVRLRGLNPAKLESLVSSAGFEKYRGRQLFHWLHKQGARSLEEMQNLPGKLREWLSEDAELGGIRDVAEVKESRDGSYKFLFLLDDGKKVESVLMPDPKRNYWTQCLSSQVGCAVDCKFCVTGFNGFFRQMRADEIADQVLYARRYLKERNPEANYRNLVYMGMGEPLLNPDAVITSIRLLTETQGAALSPRRITVSTSGIIPGMIQLAESGTNACIALSLNATTEESRREIMPITKKYSIAELLDTLRSYTFNRNKRPTIEYVMLAGFNDSDEDARRLVRMLRDIPCKINLIPFNPSDQLPFGRPERERVDHFADLLAAENYTVMVRWSKALDVDGACGQLAGQHRQRQPRPDESAQVRAALGDLDFFATVAGDDEDE